MSLLVFLSNLIFLKTARKIKRLIVLLSILFCIIVKGYSQKGFSLPQSLEKDKISFKLVNNLVVIPVEVNGTTLTFLLDTGVSSTIMFSVSEVDSLELNNATSVKLRGLGGGGSITALKSKNNILKIGKATDNNHTVYVIFDKSLNLSTRMGIPIHGIVGFEFFKNLIVKTNYISKKLIFYNPEMFLPKKCKKCELFDLTFQNKKAYINIDVTTPEFSKEVTLLIDSGSSDALWIFDEKDFIDTTLKKYFDDFLGQGLSGGIYGKRSKLSKIKIGSFKLNNVKVAFPNKESMENIKFFKDRDGSLGGEILKRFTIIYDYPNKKISLKKNGKFREPFHYNMSGLTLKHDGVVLVKDKNYSHSSDKEIDGAMSLSLSTVYSFYLVPKYIVSEIREDSPAALAGIFKGDEILSVNGKETYKFELHELIGLFASKSGKKMILRIKRNGIVFKKKFYLKEVL